MVTEWAIVKSLCLKLFHVTYVARLLHICALKVKSHLSHVNQLVAKSNQQQLKTKPDKPNSLPLVVCLSLFLQDEEAS